MIISCFNVCNSHFIRNFAPRGGGHLTLSRDQIINCYLVFRIWIHGEFIFETRCVRFAKILVEFLDTNIK